MAFFGGCGFFAYNWKLPAYSGASLLTANNFSFFTYNIGAFLLTILAFLLTVGAFCLQWEVRLMRALRDCKQRRLTVSKKAPTVSKKASPFFCCRFVSTVLEVDTSQVNVILQRYHPNTDMRCDRTLRNFCLPGGLAIFSSHMT